MNFHLVSDSSYEPKIDLCLALRGRRGRWGNIAKAACWLSIRAVCGHLSPTRCQNRSQLIVKPLAWPRWSNGARTTTKEVCLMRMASARPACMLTLLAIVASANGGLLKGIDPILSQDLLYVLRSMGHGELRC